MPGFNSLHFVTPNGRCWYSGCFIAAEGVHNRKHSAVSENQNF